MKCPKCDGKLSTQKLPNTDAIATTCRACLSENMLKLREQGKTDSEIMNEYHQQLRANAQ